MKSSGTLKKNTMMLSSLDVQGADGTSITHMLPSTYSEVVISRFFTKWESSARRHESESKGKKAGRCHKWFVNIIPGGRKVLMH